MSHRRRLFVFINNLHRDRFSRGVISPVVALVALGIVLIGLAGTVYLAQRQTRLDPQAADGADLTVSNITLTYYDDNNTQTIEVTVRNDGNQSAGNHFLNIYIDPFDNPPTINTTPTYEEEWAGYDPVGAISG